MLRTGRPFLNTCWYGVQPWSFHLRFMVQINADSVFTRCLQTNSSETYIGVRAPLPDQEKNRRQPIVPRQCFSAGPLADVGWHRSEGFQFEGFCLPAMRAT